MGAQRWREAPGVTPRNLESSVRALDSHRPWDWILRQLLPCPHPLCLQVILLSTQIKKPFSQEGLAQLPWPLGALLGGPLGQKIPPVGPAAPGLPELVSPQIFSPSPVFWLFICIVKPQTPQRSAKKNHLRFHHPEIIAINILMTSKHLSLEPSFLIMSY